jgi:ABC-type dipeptide/oligopeptide/nickel transport system permease subunit
MSIAEIEATEVAFEAPAGGLWRDAWYRLRRNPGALVGFGLVGAFVIIALSAPLIAPESPLEQNLLLVTSGCCPGPSAHHLLGVDQLGRDELSRLIYGARFSLLIGVVAVSVGLSLGLLLGALAGYFGGWIDSLFSRFMDLILAFPLVLFAIALISVLPPTRGFRIAVMIFIIGGFSWPYIGRIVRGQTLSLREREFVESARSIGAGSFRIIFRELLPNLAAPILVYSTLIIPTNILFEAALSFLGVGVPPPTPSWGRLLSDAVQYYEFDPMYMVVPGMAIFITVLAFNLFGDGLRDALDPRANR